MSRKLLRINQNFGFIYEGLTVTKISYINTINNLNQYLTISMMFYVGNLMFTFDMYTRTAKKNTCTAGVPKL